MKQYRSRVEILAHILEAAKGRHVRPAEVLSRASLSHIPFKQSLLLLIGDGLIEYTYSQRTCRTTEKGLPFLKIFNEMKNLSAISSL
jgi:predicted transcriptional regulator